MTDKRKKIEEMIGEGINVKSFNSVITASNCDKTAMQQIGRAVRNFSIQKLVAEKHEQTASSFWKIGKIDSQICWNILIAKTIVL